jgi:outer membrane protein OmpA-like peptidoglycan-associated protein
LKLSQKRAESTVKYLIEHGIDAKRLVPKGYGETKILNQCKNGVKCSEEDHEFNRRVEMKVL